jgi:transposase
VEQLIRIGLDTSKRFFQLHGVDAAERPVLRRQLRRSEVIGFFSRLAPTLVALEACGASHYWARELRALGHDARLIAPQLAKPYVKRGKNDSADGAGSVRGGEPADDAFCRGEVGGPASGLDAGGPT